MYSTTTRIHEGVGRLLVAAVAVAVALTGVTLGPAVHAVTSSAASTAVDADDMGPATMTFVNPNSASVGEARFVTFTIEGNRNAGKPAWIELSRYNFDTEEQELVYRHDVVMTSAPQIVQIPVDTSQDGSHLYFADYDYFDGSCGSAGFSYYVFDGGVPLPPSDPSDEDEAGEPTASVTALTLDTSATKVSPGAKVRLSGKVSGANAANQRVIALAKTSRGWARTGLATTNSNGRYTLRTRGLSLGVRQLRVSVPRLGISATRTIRVRR